MGLDGQLQAVAALPPGRASDHFVGDWFGLQALSGRSVAVRIRNTMFVHLAAAWSPYRLSSFVGCTVHHQPRNVSELHRNDNEKPCLRGTAVGSQGAV